MSNPKNGVSIWQLERQQRTRDLLYEIPLTPDDYIHLKHEDLGYAKISILDLIASKFILHHKLNAQIYEFSGVEELIQAGWLVD